MDLVFEFTKHFGPVRPREDSWAYFLAGVMRTARFTARELHAAIVGPSMALAGLSREGAGERQLIQQELHTLAYGRPLPARPLIVGPNSP